MINQLNVAFNCSLIQMRIAEEMHPTLWRKTKRSVVGLPLLRHRRYKLLTEISPPQHMAQQLMIQQLTDTRVFTRVVCQIRSVDQSGQC